MMNRIMDERRESANQQRSNEEGLQSLLRKSPNSKSHILPVSTLDIAFNKESKLNPSSATGHGAFLRMMSLSILVLQNTMLVLLMRASRNQKDETGNPLVYAPSVAVVTMELMKFITTIFLVYRIVGEGNLRRTFAIFHLHLVQRFRSEFLPMFLPAALYAMQNNLGYIALSNLDAATFQVSYQLKLLTTAMFAGILLGRRLSTQKWIALFVLMVGVMLVQLPADTASRLSARFFGIQSEQENLVILVEKKNSGESTFVGLMAILAACLSSGYSGVYFEKLLKGSETNIWIRNLQLGIPGLMFSILAILFDKDGPSFDSPYHGFTVLVWSVVALQALGGLVVAVVIKYADNILKGFATSISIVLSCLVSVYAFGFVPTLPFISGAVLVLVATYLYSKPDL